MIRSFTLAALLLLGCTQVLEVAGECLDTASDPKNCGRCGHSCQGGACTSGVCQAVKIWEGGGVSSALAADEDAVYLALVGGGLGTAGGAIWRMGLGGESPGAIAQAADPRAITLDGQYIYWVNYVLTGTVQKVPRAGGATVVLASGQVLPDAIAVSGEEVFWTASNGVLRTSVTPGGPVTEVASEAVSPRGVAANRDFVYWSVGMTVRRAPRGGGSTAVFATTRAPDRIVLGSTHAYWLDAPYDVNLSASFARAPLSGGPVELFPLPFKPGALAADGGVAYWSNSDGNQYELQRLSNDRATPERIASSPDMVLALGTNRDSIFFAAFTGQGTAPTAVFRLAK